MHSWLKKNESYIPRWKGFSRTPDKRGFALSNLCLETFFISTGTNQPGCLPPGFIGRNHLTCIKSSS
uniref:Uncharacterized protein n=1 Tax=Picea glauca TaxID=3330 RepID=A0A101LU51_PICGL|nr:hypothetical protein ABT39_MTgene2689 [Picea glauca]